MHNAVTVRVKIKSTLSLFIRKGAILVILVILVMGVEVLAAWTRPLLLTPRCQEPS